MHPTLALQDNTEHLTAKDVFLWNALEHLYRTMTAESLSRSLQRCQLGPTRTAFHLWRWCPPSLFKVGGSPFDILPGGTSPERVRPDIVHTFHLPPEPGSSKSLVSPQSAGKPRYCYVWVKTQVLTWYVLMIRSSEQHWICSEPNHWLSNLPGPSSSIPVAFFFQSFSGQIGLAT